MMRWNLYYLIFIVCVHSTLSESLDSENDDIKLLLKDIVERLDEKNAVIARQDQRIAALENDISNIKMAHNVNVPTNDDKTVKVTVTGINKKAELNPVNVMRDDPPSESTSLKRRRRAENEMSVAFLASLTDHITHTGVDQNVVFDKVITNIGDGYHTALGAFIAPVSGIYVFSSSILSFGDLGNSFEFQHNGQRVVRLYHNPADGSYVTAAATVTLKLVEGDDVSVASMATDKSIHGNEYSLFTGFLLEQLYDDTAIVGK